MMIQYKEVSPDKIDLIKPLWEALNRLHLNRSVNFTEDFSSFTFEWRKKKLLEKEKIRIMIARESDVLVGYCIASVNGDVGEIDSLFVQSEYRKMGIGEELMRRSIRWVELFEPEEISLKVAAGNEAVFAFYSRFNFYPSSTKLRYKK